MRGVLALTVAATLVACSTPYQPSGILGGFTETQLDRNVFRVSFSGNGFTSGTRAEELALLHSAEVTLKNGFTHFAIVDGRSRTSYDAYANPTQSRTLGTVTSTGSGATFAADTRTTGGEVVVTAKPSTTNTIVCFNGRPNIAGVVFDAQFMFNSLSAKYGVSGNK